MASIALKALYTKPRPDSIGMSQQSQTGQDAIMLLYLSWGSFGSNFDNSP